MAGAAVQLAVRTQANKSKLSRPLSASVAESVEYVGGNELRAFLQATVPEGCPCAVLGLPPYPFSRLAICGGLDGLATNTQQSLQLKPTGERSSRPGDAFDPPGPLLMGREGG